MKLVPDLDPEKKVIPWDLKRCILMRMSLLKKEYRVHLSASLPGGAASGKNRALSEQGTPWGPDDDETPLLLCRFGT